jgi:hypothetical protein
MRRAEFGQRRLFGNTGLLVANAGHRPATGIIEQIPTGTELLRAGHPARLLEVVGLALAYQRIEIHGGLRSTRTG